MKRLFLPLIFLMVLATTNGQIVVKLKLPNNCQAITSSNIEKSVSEATIKLSPNPTKGIFNIKLFSTGNIKDVSLTIYELTGRLVYAERIHEATNYLNRDILTDFLSPGTYLLHLQTQEREFVERLVVIE